ncbi:glycosyltransferase involved in cell wall biosynthesis [Catenulispora sp. GAS73]|uniref:glycosyltransferase n=1 Tax=Catenulispora sp. GAS73 TaxID=3156269 RepID=UPI0035153F83
MSETHTPLGTRLAIVSTYAPRRCGIATFSQDLTTALAHSAPDLAVEICALDRDGLDYPAEVSTVIGQDSYSDYRKAAARLADSGVDAVVIEHEYGIFGGNDGAWITGFAGELVRRGVPYLVTLHTVLSEPTWTQASTLNRLCQDAAAVTVFTETARTLVVRTGIAPPDRIVYVPHGAPEPVTDQLTSYEIGPEGRRTLDALAGRRLLSTFGLISPGKGLQTAIEALGLIAEEHPDVSYLIAGSTHPEIVRNSGEDYRDSLMRVAKEAGVADRVVFLDSFLTEMEIGAILAQTEIFLTPYRSREQISSGALTFAVAAGKPVVSTAYHYAVDMLGDGAGITVPPEDPEAFAGALRTLLGDDERLAAARRAARERGAGLRWDAVAQRFAAIVRACAAQRRLKGPAAHAAGTANTAHAASTTGAASTASTATAGNTPSAVRPDRSKHNDRPKHPKHPEPTKHTERFELPRLKLKHLTRLTDSGGIMQFGQGLRPDPASGHCVDDVARLAIVAAGLCGEQPQALRAAAPHTWLDTSLDFLLAAYDPESRAVRNMRTLDGRWLDEPHSGDHVGRLVWGLGEVASSPAVPDKFRERASEQLMDVLPAVEGLTSLRSMAYAVLGLVQIPEPTPQLDRCVERLDAAWQDTATSQWPWFEKQLTYDNARLAQALLAGGARAGDAAMAERGLIALDWYLEQVGLDPAGYSAGDPAEDPAEGPAQDPERGQLRLVGNLWRHKGKGVARPEDEGDEQPIDAAAVVEAGAQAWRVTRQERYASLARRSFGWFLGDNRLGLPLYDAGSGGCRDGLASGDTSVNQGAESTLAYYQARLGLIRAGLADARGTADQ